MRRSPWQAVFDAVGGVAIPYLDGLPERPVWSAVPVEEARARFGGPLPEDGRDPVDVVAALGHDLEPLVTAHASGRFYGFVIGGLHPAAYGAELLVSTFDQNAGLYAPTPGVAAVEEVAAGWLLELLDLPRDAAVGMVTGGQMASFTCLAAARDHVLRAGGWDVEADGLQGAPKVHVLTKSQRHTTIPRALRFLGLGERTAREIEVDEQDRMRVDRLVEALEATTGPTIVCIESGNVNTGSFDRFPAVADAVDAHRARGNPTWVHVDGAVGLWARAGSDATRTVGLERADSWSTDAHKLLNVPYDSGVAITRHPAAHRAAMSVQASYLVHAAAGERDPMDWNPEFSRRARGVAIYAVLRSLGRRGVRELVDASGRLARRFASQLEERGLARIANEVVFNQVLVDWIVPGGASGDEADRFCDALIAAVDREGEAFFSGTTWRGRRLMRISVSDWATDEADVDRALAAIERAHGELAG